MKRSLLLLLFIANVLTVYGFPPAALPTPAAPTPAIVTYRNDNPRTGQNLNETILTTTNGNATTVGTLNFTAAPGSGKKRTLNETMKRRENILTLSPGRIELMRGTKS